MNPESRFVSILKENGFHLDVMQESALKKYVSALTEWNKKVNLVSRTEGQNIWFSHILHSVSPLLFVEIPRGSSVLDLGTGGGLPGLPIAILRPDLKMTLLDSIKKKILALDAIVSDLSIQNVRVLSGRAEELSKGGGSHETFDVVLARAVGPLHELIRWVKPWVRRPACGTVTTQSAHQTTLRKTYSTPFLLAWKGGDLSAEIQTAKVKTGEQRISVIDLVFPGIVETGLEEKKAVIVEL